MTIALFSYLRKWNCWPYPSEMATHENISIDVIRCVMANNVIMDDRRQVLRFRTELVLNNLRNCHSGADIHEAINIKQTAIFVISSIEQDEDIAHIEMIVARLESRCLRFFQRRFSYLC